MSPRGGVAACRSAKHLIVKRAPVTAKRCWLPVAGIASPGRRHYPTGTKTCRTAPFFRDVPFLESIAGTALRVCYMKGRGKLPFPQQVYSLAGPPIWNGLEEIDQFQQIAAGGKKDHPDRDRWRSTRWARASPRLCPSCTRATRPALGQNCPT